MAREDGRFELYYSDGYAVLTVFPPEAGGKPVYSDDVLNRMRILRVPRVPSKIIQDVIDAAAGAPVRLVEWPAGEELSSSYTVEVDDAERTACVVLRRPKKGGGLPTHKEIDAALSDAGVVHGIDSEAIDRILEHPVYDKPICVARATEPVHGRPPVVEYTFETDTGKPFLVDDSGRMDLRELNFIQQKHEGDVLARIIPAVVPADGTTVRGQTIPAQPAPPAHLVRPGNNAELSSDETEIRATTDGNTFVQSGAVHVEPIVSVDEVDYHTGNISFEGTVQIRRGIADGFTVHAGGCLEIGEAVGRVQISAGRQLILKGGMNGAEEGSIDCDGDVFAKYIESARVFCRGTLFVVDAIMHSTAMIHRNLGLRGKHGGLIGGSMLVGGSVWCKKLGSVSETPTRLSVGIDPDQLKEFGELNTRAEELRDRIDDLDRILRHLEGKLELEGQIDKPQTMAAVRGEREQNVSELADAERRIKELRADMVASPKVRVVVEEQIYPRVIVTFGRAEYRSPTNGTDRTILKCIDEKVIEGGFNPSEPPDFETIIGTPGGE